MLPSGAKRFAFFALLGLVAIGAVAYTFTSATAYSAFAAALFKASVCLGLWAVADRYVLDEIDTVDALENGNVAVAIALLALALLLAPAIATGQPVVQQACQEVGVTEHPPGSNEGAAIDRYMEAVNLNDGLPWCAGFARYVLDAASADEPVVRSAAATDYITGRSVDATDVLRGTEVVSSGALAIWRRGDTWRGHIGIVTSWQRQCGSTIEGNTSPGESGPQRDGDGVWARKRCIHPGSYFRITAFTPTS